MLVVGQMVRIHLMDGAELRDRGERQASSLLDLPAQRGAILDRAGRALAVNTARYEIAADPTAPGFAARAGNLYETLSDLTGKSPDHYRQSVADRASRQYVVLVRDMGEAEKQALDAGEFPGLRIDGSYRRHYNYGQTAAHVLGHVNRDMKGADGIEMQLDASLKGIPGRQAVQRDRRGQVKAVVGGTRVEPENGEDIVLTIDLVRQAILEEELAKGVEAAGAAWGTALAMDPRTGAILALANVPTYDPNRPASFSEAARRNHAVADHIEPGSTFKLVTAVAALESGTMRTSDSLNTGGGWHVFHGRTMRDEHGYGRISFGDAIVKSSNVAMAMTAERMGRGALYRTARDLGFGQATLIDLPGEVPGTLRRPENWGALTLPWMSTGYAMEATPLQILTAYAALANGGLLVKPYVVAERRNARTGQTVWQARPDSVRRAFQPETARSLMPYFENVVSSGRGTGARAEVEGLRIAGKTGTAKKAMGGGYSSSYRSSFVGLFPVEAPEVVLLIILDSATNGYSGGAVSAPIFGAVAQRWVGTLPNVAARVAPSEQIPTRTAAAVPAIQGMPLALAASRLTAEGFPVRFDSDDPLWRPASFVTPVSGAQPLNTALKLRPSDSATTGSARASAPARAAARTMPDLRGKSMREAVAWLRSLGAEPVIRGSGTVARQSVRAGARLPGRVVLDGGGAATP